jgi:hypothetical protein
MARFHDKVTVLPLSHATQILAVGKYSQRYNLSPSIAKKIPSMLKNWHRRKNNPIDGQKNSSNGKFYAILHKFCQRLKKIHEFR